MFEEKSQKALNGSGSGGEPFFLDRAVKKGKNQVLKHTLRTLIKRLGMSEPDFYHSIGLSKQYWYMISWGLEETPQPIKIKISKALDTDTSLIWEGC